MQSLDQPLDAIIQSKRKERQPRRQRGSRPQSSKQAAGVAQTQQLAQPVPAAQAVASQVHVGDKIIVSNLPDDVNEQQIKELFHTTVGTVRSVNLSYNAQGKSKGIATIQFHRADSATAAYQQYNKRLIDGKRPMKVEIIVDPSRTARTPTGPAASLTQRLAPAAAPSATVAAASGSAVQQPGGRQPGGGPRRGAGGRGRGRRGGRNGGSERPAATVESLDQEMSDWQAQSSAQNGTEGAATA
ncbi:hypothetical protein JCM16303_001801 [Sporobolomyces ruberrimus]